MTATLLFASVLAHADTFTVSPTVTNIGGGLYQYAYSLSYTGTNDAFLVDISVPKNSSAVSMLTTPAGFTSQFDSVLGLVSFLEGTSSFTATPTSGFFFDSPFAPGTSTYSASIFDNAGNISTLSGTTTAPVVTVATPEPSFLFAFALMLPILFVVNRRKQCR